jgi:hypothetical protein
MHPKEIYGTGHILTIKPTNTLAYHAKKVFLIKLVKVISKPKIN